MSFEPVERAGLPNFWVSVKGAGGGLHEKFSEIDFLVVMYRGDRYLTDAFGPMKKYCS